MVLLICKLCGSPLTLIDDNNIYNLDDIVGSRVPQDPLKMYLCQNCEAQSVRCSDCFVNCVLRSVCGINKDARMTRNENGEISIYVGLCSWYSNDSLLTWLKGIQNGVIYITDGDTFTANGLREHGISYAINESPQLEFHDYVFDVKDQNITAIPIHDYESLNNSLLNDYHICITGPDGGGYYSFECPNCLTTFKSSDK